MHIYLFLLKGILPVWQQSKEKRNLFVKAPLVLCNYSHVLAQSVFPFAHPISQDLRLALLWQKGRTAAYWRRGIAPVRATKHFRAFVWLFTDFKKIPA
ncbi:MAG: hypothetical protein KDD06_01040 [Phaeodactylibacter sp.]|nr:hypothetical protein [Phaeodactylibacter sp.]MCB9266268.1 hypothetical protein [Lewinellaceae bacterium]MCB9285971.1 hypothetical protein [Lewinellaceae bacterium]